MTWETVMGLEVHVELSTKSKIFCSCTTQFGGEPNTHCCPGCWGMPGTLPVLNEKVLEYALKAGLALNCEITRYNQFDRKNYFYPDLTKAYQISQIYLPFARNGYVDIVTRSGEEKRIRIHEIHMEEDAGKLIHSAYGDYTYPDFNRCGIALIEIVSKPDFRSSQEVIAYLEQIKSTLEYLGISDVKMEEGSLRADVNLSVRPLGSDKLGIRTEMKNINSFKSIERAIDYETSRHIETLETGGLLVQETRRWDDNKGKTFSMRSKENSRDYRFFPDPDIPPISISEEFLLQLKAQQPELAHEKKVRYMSQYGLSEYEARLLTESKFLAKLFEETVELSKNPKETAVWMLGDMMYLMKEQSLEASKLCISHEQFAAFITAVASGKINRTVAKPIFEKVFASHDFDVNKYIKANNLLQINDEDIIKQVAKEVINENPGTVDEYKSGKNKVFSFFVGQTMKKLHGKANPSTVNAIVSEELEKI
ncbi:MAG: Aspartyl/glutamyl-tRNA(Asn/Gln) amidotransferase subunit B [Firmicutes bacterium ADurb.Bin300]|jgi:aspartyl-tRNA(Asn)/glutamyl-tRNA(Gln) amidotransferase subunit B|nr:MAG: Aspartyl/glutamyl-tRNA(Asn/Gln) amidotransferase subunit B [Firmicutes bacterium ADurb.Bin300]HOD02399.1 Asp-tRNA(Asn)/Glu-tRNA(Gln) amidotransferase subunit GatB [Clostridiales bacterium]